MRMIAALKRVNRNTLRCEEIKFTCLDLESLLKNVMEYSRDLGNDEYTDWQLVKAFVAEEEGE